MSILDELDAMTTHLRDYVLDGELFKTITVEGLTNDELIKMTIGGMVERIETLNERGDAPDMVAAAQAVLSREQQAQPEAFWGLVAREAKSYADSWAWYLQRVAEGDEQAAQDYPQEVPLRLRLERLLALGGDNATLGDVKRRTADLDRKLQNMWRSGGGPHGSGTAAYDREAHWWLYGQPVAPQAD